MKTAGFTLLEMLIAVVIIAVVGITLSTAISGVANQTFSLERRSVAHWLAQNQVTRLRIDLRSNPRVLPEGKDSVRIFMSNRDWEVRTQIKPTEHPLMRRIEIDVYEIQDSGPVGPFDHLIAFVGRR